MVKINLKVHEGQKKMYIPRALLPIIGFEPIAIPNAFSVLLFKKDEDIDKVIKSVGIILQDLELQKEFE